MPAPRTLQPVTYHPGYNTQHLVILPCRSKKMDVTNERVNCCEHKTHANKCRLCYNAYFQAYRKKIAEIENSKVQTRNKYMLREVTMPAFCVLTVKT